MCDISSTRKSFVVLSVAILFNIIFAEPQVNLNIQQPTQYSTRAPPNYNSDDPNFGNNVYDQSDVVRSGPYNPQIGQNPQFIPSPQYGAQNPQYTQNPQYPQNPQFSPRPGFNQNPQYSSTTPRYYPDVNVDQNNRFAGRNPNDPGNRREGNFQGNPNDPGNRREGNFPGNSNDPGNRREGNFPGGPPPPGTDIRALLQALDLQASQQCTNNVAAQWNFETNVNQATQLEALNAQQLYSDFQHGVWELLNKVGGTVPDEQTYRQIRYLSVVGPAALSPDQLDRYNRLINDMLAIYNTASICAHNDHFTCGLRLQPDLIHIMARSRNWDELQHVWTEWRRNTGQKIKDLYEQMIVISNDAAKLNNFTDTAQYWNFPFESANLNIDIEDAWEEVKPLYQHLHAYVRRRLREYYGTEKISRQAPLPAHILGNMWAQTWSNIFDITQPYPGQTFLDVTPEMLRQGYSPLDIFQLAEDFFVTMNMTAMPLDFWQGSVIEEPLDRVVLCQPSAWDFCNRRDFRIKMCTNVNMKDLITAHHEMAHIHYFMQYKNQPKVFRDGANPAFHEAIGEAIGLSVGTPRHLQALGLVQSSVDDIQVDVNYLYAMALEKVAFLPFALVMDKWRYDVFRGEINKEQYNCHWWRLAEQYMGIKPPVLRSEIDFDPGSKYHIPANIPYLRYFVSTLLQFQIYRSLCVQSGQFIPGDPTKPLHKCDIYRSKEAGRILMQLMEKGSSLPWRDVLFQVTGETRLDGSAMVEYFRPLQEWLRNDNLRSNQYLGWLYDGDYCKQSIETAGLQVYGGFYSKSNRLVSTNLFLLVLFSLIYLQYL